LDTHLQPSLTQSLGTQEDRSNLLKDLTNLSIQAAYGVQRLNDQHVNQVLSGLVRAKLLSADDSYLLKDRLLDRDTLDRAIDSRIEAALRRRGVISNELTREMQTQSIKPIV
jgi:hypothetical protein